MNKLLGLVVVVVSSLLLSGLLYSQPVSAVDNFVITNYEVAMELGRDSDGRSTLRTTETITADFQQRNENRGLERSFVKTYDGHKTSFKLESVTNQNGDTLPHHWNGDTLRIGEEDVFVFGPQTYKITFTERDVTRYYADTKKDEFYWDVIGGDWRVPIQQATVNVALASDIQAATQTDMQCYTGSFGSTDRCEVVEQNGVYTVSASNLGNRSGMTVALGFAPETFAKYQPSLIEKWLVIWGIITAVTSAVAVGIIIWLAVRAHRWTYRSAELGTIVPEYIPPKDASVAASAAVSPGLHATMAAELTDLAVRHYIQILETKVKKVFLPGEYDIKVVKDISDLRSEEKEILSDMFGYVPKVGDRLALKDLKNNSNAYSRFLDNDKKLKDLLRGTYELKHIDQEKRGWYSKTAKILLLLAVPLLSPLLFIAGIIAFVISKTLWVLSDKGLELRRYLKGLEMYIKVAETERLKMLQSPEGAEKVAIKDATNPAELVKLYERVLPYAVLFGQEKEWTKQLGEYYASMESSPEWYSGRTAFNAAAFSSAMSSFSSAVATTSASSSSSGGSSGGGFSGGGGGGGGGGGW